MLCASNNCRWPFLYHTRMQTFEFCVLCCRVFVFCPFSCEKKRYLYYSVDSFTRRQQSDLSELSSRIVETSTIIFEVIFWPHKINIINTISGVLLFKVHCQFECQDIISRNGKYVIPKNNCFLVALSCLKEHFVWDFSNTPHRWTDTQSCSVGLADVKLSPFIDITLFDTQT